MEGMGVNFIFFDVFKILGDFLKFFNLKLC